MLRDDPLSADVDHPIPNPDTCDVHMIRKDGGADLAIVIAKPISDDARSRARLMKKIEKYLEFIQSDDFRTECGAPSTTNTSITVHLHPDSSPSILNLLERCAGWIEDNSATLRIQKGA